MTILPPPQPLTQHLCNTPTPFHVSVHTDDPDLPSRSIDIDRPAYRDGTLWECPHCRRWWKYSLHEQPPHDGPTYTVLVTTYNPEWTPVSAWDIKARRRIAAHETEKNGTPDPLVGLPP